MVLSKTELINLIYKDERAGISSFSPSFHRSGLHSLRPSFRSDEGSHSLMPDISHRSERGTFLEITPFEKGQLGTVGLDLRVGKLIAWSDVVEDNVGYGSLVKMEHKYLGQGEKFVLEPNEDGEKVYYLTSFEEVKFSDDLEMMVDSKSTTGRVGGMSHGVGRTREGNLITIIQPYAFPLMVECGKTKLSQAIFRYKRTHYMTNEEILNSNEVSFKGENISLRKSSTF